MKNAHLFLGLLIIACMMITPVMGETINGDLGSTGWTSVNYDFGNSEHYYWGESAMYFRATNIEYITNPQALIHFDNGTPAVFPQPKYCSWGAESSNSTIRFNWSVYENEKWREIVTGTFGFQRSFTGFPPTEKPGYQFWLFDNNWNTTGVTGTQTILQQWTDGSGDNCYAITLYSAMFEPPLNAPVGYIHKFGVDGGGGYAGATSGLWTLNTDNPFLNNYTVTKPSGLGITGTIHKTVDGTTYQSQPYIYNWTSKALITSQSGMSTNDFTFNVPQESIFISLKKPDGGYVNSTQLFNVSGPVTPTPTPTTTLSPLDYTLTLNASAVTFGGSLSATIASNNDPSLSHINGIAYSYISPTSTPNTVNFMEPGSTDDVMNYALLGATWKGFKWSSMDFTNNKAGIPNPAILKFTETGVLDVQVVVNTDAGDNILLHIPVTVGQGTFKTTTFQAYDGSNFGFLQAVEIDVKNLNTGLWTNGTYFNGKVSITTPPNQLLSAYGTRAGYYPAKYENAPADGTPYSLVFYQIGAPPVIDHQIFYVNTITPAGVRVSGVVVRANEVGSTNTTTGTTSAAGSTQLNLLTNTSYAITATKSGYTGASRSYTTNTGTSDSITMTLIPIVNPTVIPTGSWTVNPSLTPSGGGNGTFWKPWTDLFSQMGASNYEMPILLAAFILLMCMLVGFAMAGVLGGEIALGFGAILCVALGLIPIWVVLAIIILGFLFYGLKVVK